MVSRELADAQKKTVPSHSGSKKMRKVIDKQRKKEYNILKFIDLSGETEKYICIYLSQENSEAASLRFVI